jgi:hypothetical protein
METQPQQQRTAVRPATQLPLKDEDELEDEFAENSSGSSAPEVQKTPILSVFSAGGAEGGRTPDLLIANEEGLNVARRLRIASSPEVPIHAIVC